MNQASILNDHERSIGRPQSCTYFGIALFAFLFERIMLPCIRLFTPSNSLPLEWQKMGEDDSFKLRKKATQHYRDCALYYSNSRLPCLKCLEYLAGFTPVFDWRKVTVELLKGLVNALVAALFVFGSMIMALGTFCIAMWFVGPNLTPQQRRRLEEERARKEAAQREWEHARDQCDRERQQEQDDWERRRQEDWDRQREALDWERDNAQRQWEQERDEHEQSRRQSQEEWERQRDENWQHEREQRDLEQQLAQLEWEHKEFEYHRDKKAADDLRHTDNDLIDKLRYEHTGDIDSRWIEKQVHNEESDIEQDLDHIVKAEEQRRKNEELVRELNATRAIYVDDLALKIDDNIVKEANHLAEPASKNETPEETEKRLIDRGKILEASTHIRHDESYTTNDEADEDRKNRRR